MPERSSFWNLDPSLAGHDRLADDPDDRLVPQAIAGKPIALPGPSASVLSGGIPSSSTRVRGRNGGGSRMGSRTLYTAVF